MRMEGISFDTVECMRRELMILEKVGKRERDGFTPDERVKVFVELRDYSLVDLLERRYMYGCDWEVDLCRLLGRRVEYSCACDKSE